jgi:5-methylcytosine-specific restriction endonuclease McrA
LNISGCTLSLSKACRRCGWVLDRSYFDVKRRECRNCRVTKKRPAAKQRRADNPEHARAIARAWRKANPDKLKASLKKWAGENRAYINETERKRRETNPNYSRDRSAAARKWRENNPGLARERAVAYNKAHAAYKRAWKKANLSKCTPSIERRRARLAGAKGSYTAAQWKRLKEFHGGICLCCGVHESVSKLTVDHVLPLSKGGSDFITNIQPLCGSCNSSKRDKHIDYRQICLLEIA